MPTVSGYTPHPQGRYGTHLSGWQGSPALELNNNSVISGTIAWLRQRGETDGVINYEFGNTPLTVVGISGQGTLNYHAKWTPDGNTLGDASMYEVEDTGFGVLDEFATFNQGTFTITTSKSLENYNANVLTLEATTTYSPVSTGYGPNMIFSATDGSGLSNQIATITANWIGFSPNAGQLGISVTPGTTGVQVQMRARPDLGVGRGAICFLDATTPLPRQAGDVGTALVGFGLMSGTPTFNAGNLTGTLAVARLPTLNGFTDAEAALTDIFPKYDASASANRDVTLERIAGFINPKLCDFRLSLTSNTAFTTSDVTGAGTLYMVPCDYSLTSAGEGRISLYDGTRWKLHKTAQVSLGLSVTSGTVYDVFVYDNSGTLTLELTAWTNTTTRATALVLQDGVLLKSGALTRRYLGTLYASGSNTCEDSRTKRFLWNYYNRRPRALRLNTSGNGTYATADWRYFLNSSANRVEFVLGLTEDPVECTALAVAGGNGSIGMHLDSATPTAPDSMTGYFNDNSTGAFTNLNAFYCEHPSQGYHFLAMIEYAFASTTFYGSDTNGGDTYLQGGMRGLMWG